MPDEATPTAAPNAGLDDLERRLASFENATRRLGRSVSEIAEPVATGHSSPPRPATRRLSESGAPRGEEISGLRPAVASQGPQTGALTARSRSGATSPVSPPAFTSKFGRPALSPPPELPVVPERRSVPAQHRSLLGLALAGCLVAFLFLVLLVAKSSFPIIPQAQVHAPTVSVLSRIDGNVSQVLVRVGSTTSLGQPLVEIANRLLATDTLDALRRERAAYPERAAAIDAMITAEESRLAKLSADSLVAPSDGEVVSILVNPGSRVVPGQPVLKISSPGTEHVLACVPDGVFVELGWRVELHSAESGLISGGVVSRILEVGQGDDVGDVRTRRLVITPDPGARRPKHGTSVSVMLIGASPSSLRLALLAVRKLLP